MIALVFFATTFSVAASAQCFEGGELGRLMAGPCAERIFRQAYAPVDKVLGAIGPGGYFDSYGYPIGYGYGGYGQSRTATVAAGAMAGMATGAGLGAAIGQDTRSALIGAGAGAAAGGLLSYVATRNTGLPSYNWAGQPTYLLDGRQVVFAAPEPQKPLNCSKPKGKRGKNEAACAAVEAALAEQQAVTAEREAAQQEAAQRQACLDRLASSSWRLRNGSDRFTFYPTVGGQPMTVCGEPLVLRPLQTVRIFPPDGQIGGYSFGAGASGETVEFTAKVQALNRPGFIGFVLMAPGAPEGGK
jgi:hypothetical protein